MHFFLVNDYCRVTSSEKVDKIQRYSDFYLCSVPYPGMLHWEFWHGSPVNHICVAKNVFGIFFFSFILMYFLLLQVVNFLETLRTMSTMQRVYILIGNRWEIKIFFGASFTLSEDDKLESSQTYCLTVCMILDWLFLDWLLDCPANILS